MPSPTNREKLREALDELLSAAMPIHPEHQIDKRNILNGAMDFFDSCLLSQRNALLDELTAQNVINASSIRYDDWEGECDGIPKIGDCVDLFYEFNDSFGYREIHETGFVEADGVFPIICNIDSETSVAFHHLPSISRITPTEEQIKRHKELNCGFYGPLPFQPLKLNVIRLKENK